MALPLVLCYFLLLPSPLFLLDPPSPIIVKIVPPSGDPTGISDLILGAIGLTGVLSLIAISLGVLIAVVLFWKRSGRPLDH